VSYYPFAEIRQIIRLKVSQGAAVDVDALVSIAKPHFRDENLEQLARIIRVMVIEAGGRTYAAAADERSAPEMPLSFLRGA
jgi:hypothetical protein